MTRASLRAGLLRWYDTNARDLPWRQTDDPYAIWVSEIMLQQTRVDTVIPYYERFIARFPTTRALATASEDEVLAAWSGLGYYRRARLLHAGVREVSQKHDGRVPRDPAARQALPGVGRYTAGAIGSIAFDQPEPIVDGNIARVLSRLLRIETRLGLAVTERRLWDEATELVRGPRPGALNQALMELGATVCTPKQPGCTRCPAQSACTAHRDGVQESLPLPRKKAAPKPVSTVVVAPVTTRGELWLIKQDAPLFGGLWALPMTRGTDRRAAQRALEDAGLQAVLPDRPSGQLTHVLSHRRFETTVFRATEASGRTDRQRQRFSADQLETVGVSKFTRKALSLLGAGPDRETPPHRASPARRRSDRKS